MGADGFPFLSSDMRPVLLPMASAVMEGFYVVLDCLVDGVPVPRVSWTRDSQLVPPCPGPRVCTESNGTLIYLRSAGVEDAGTYSCLVEGLHRRTYTVSVSVDPRDGKWVWHCQCFPLKHGADQSITLV